MSLMQAHSKKKKKEKRKKVKINSLQLLKVKPFHWAQVHDRQVNHITTKEEMSLMHAHSKKKKKKEKKERKEKEKKRPDKFFSMAS